MKNGDGRRGGARLFVRRKTARAWGENHETPAIKIGKKERKGGGRAGGARESREHGAKNKAKKVKKFAKSVDLL